MEIKSADYIHSLARVSIQDAGLVRPDWTIGDWRDPNLLWLDKNENADPALAAVTSSLFSSLPTRVLNAYPECAPLYRKLAAQLGVNVDCLLLAHGSDGVIRSVFEAFINPGDVVVHTAPTFAMYPVYSKMYGARAVPLEYQTSNRGPHLSVETVLGVIDEVQPKLICLPNPDSPTGTVFSAEDLRQIMLSAQKAKAAILIDEAYYPFYDASVLSWLHEFPHLIIARTFAKSWGVAGLRIGYAVASPTVTRLLHKVRPMYEVSTLAVAAMERLLDIREEMLASVKRLNAGKDVFLAEMEALGFRTLHGQGNFLHVAFGQYASAVHAALRDLVLYRQDFKEPCLKGFSRFSATTVELFRPIVERIRNAVIKQRE